jgi:hypothetical protein
MYQPLNLSSFKRIPLLFFYHVKKEWHMLVNIDLKVTIIIIIIYLIHTLWKIIEKYFVNLSLILKTSL